MFIKPRSHRWMLRLPKLASSLNTGPAAGQLKVRKPRRLVTFRKHWKWILAVCVLLVLAVGVFSAGGMLGIMIERKGRTEELLAINPARAAMNYLLSLGTKPDRLVIDIKHEDHEKLKAWRETALQRDQITSDLKQYVPATLRFQGKVYQAELRLKGEWVDHLKTRKWSYRVKIKGDKTLLGMTCFGIQHPRVRDYSYEWFYHQALAREDVACLRYRFVSVTVNGRDLGVHAVEEHFTKQMVEHNHRRQGVVVRIDADYRYDPYSDRPDLIDDKFDTGIRSEHAAAIKIYDEEKLVRNPVLAEQVRNAENLLEAYRCGKLPAHQAFDVEKMATYYAVSELLGSLYTIDDWSDKRFLYNPVTARLEPIGLEGCHQKLQEILGAKYSDAEAASQDFHARMFADQIFVRAYVRALDRVSRPQYVDQLLAELRPQLEHQLKILHREWPLHEFSERDLYENAERIRAYLHPRDGMHAYLAAGQPAGTIELGAIQPLPIEVLELVAGLERFAPSEPLVLPGRPKEKLVQFETASFKTPPEVQWSDLCAKGIRVRYRIMGMTQIREVPVIAHARLNQATLQTDLMQQRPNAATFSFVEVDESTRTIRFLPGHSRVDRNMIIPAGYVVRADGGVVVDLVNNATIVCFSPLHFVGDEEQPVVITSSDKSGQGLAVLDAGEESLLRHVLVRRLSTPHQGNWQLTGAITFHRSPVRIEHCEFSDNNSEDGLNIISSKFTLSHCYFANSTSDALDGDFVSGKIVDCTFHNIGGDAIDFSGSQVEVDHVRMSSITDKAVSVGEETAFRGRRIEVTEAGIGVAVKDLSEAELTDVSIQESGVGLAVFQKKPEFGPATLRVEGLKLKDVRTKDLLEVGSNLAIDKHAASATHKNVKKLVYGDAK